MSETETPLSNKILLSQTLNPWAGAQEHVDIVRELAERGPFYRYIETTPISPNSLMMSCWTCSALEDPHGDDDAANDLRDPANHEPSCLWRRSKALHADAGVRG